MSYWFFFSYAHADQDDFLNTFYTNLASEVRSLTGVGTPESGFLDRKDIEHGATWDKALEQALQECRVFVPIYSPSYFLAPYCGKEFAVFRDRLHSHLKQQGGVAADPLILPVLWNPESNVLEKIPAVIDKIQYKHGAYPTEYLTEGVLQLVRRGLAPGSGLYDQYWDFVRKFASTIVNAGTKHSLPFVPSLTPLNQVQGIFSPASQGAASAASKGPRYVQFIFVAGNQSELQAANRSDLKFYGQRGGSDWQPYLDSYKGSAAALAVEALAAISKDLSYEELPFSPGIDLDKQIKQAAGEDKIVVVMVDTWTLSIQGYYQHVAPLDEYNSLRCITVILWNDDDQEATVHKSTLETVVNGTFSTKQTQPNFLSNSIKSYDTFKRELIRALVQAQAQVVDTTEKKKKLNYALVRTPQNAEFEAKPSL